MYAHHLYVSTQHNNITSHNTVQSARAITRGEVTHQVQKLSHAACTAVVCCAVVVMTDDEKFSRLLECHLIRSLQLYLVFGNVHYNYCRLSESSMLR